jgi:hypothetical protein
VLVLEIVAVVTMTLHNSTKAALCRSEKTMIRHDQQEDSKQLQNMTKIELAQQ